MKFKTADQVVICGRKRSGKSKYLKNLCYHIPDFIVYDFHHEHSDLGHVIRYPERIPELWIKGIRKVVFYPTYRTEQELEEISEIAKGLRNLVIVIEETDCVLRGDPRHPLMKHFRDIVHTGSGHYGIGLICVTRRLANLNSDVISQTNWIVAFAQTSKADLKRLEEECGEEARQIVGKPPYHFFEFSGETGEITFYKPLKEELL